MATIGDTNLTLVDQAKRLDPDGQIALIAELLTEENEVLNMIPTQEGNLDTGHRVTVRSGLPVTAYRKLNAGVPYSKSRTVQVDESAAMLEGLSRVDKELARLGGNQARLRFTEDQAFIESMRQNFSNTLVYGDTDVDPEEHLGLAPRYDDLSADNAANIIDAGGTGADNTSVWLVNWVGIYPKGTQAGLEFNDLGERLVTDADGNDYLALVSQYIWRFGLVVKDWRYAVRIANIDMSDLTKDASGSSADLVDLMIQALEQIQSLDGSPTFLVGRTVRSFLRRQIKNDTNVRIGMDEVAGKRVVTFDEVPVLRMDSILGTEARIT
jgi:hypothetical protein